VPRPLPPVKGRLRLQIVLFVLTFLSTTLVGADHYFVFGFTFEELLAALKSRRLLVPDASSLAFYLHGLWYSVTILAILGCHEMGHYVATLRYDIAATRPYFLPLPPSDITLTGTLGAFIRLKSRIPNRIALFDVGIAGPIAGFVVAVPALFLGLWLSRVERIPPDMPFGMMLGEPLLFQFAQWVVWGNIADGYGLNMHPVAFAAWFGLLATALNLFPIAQLDGGHIAYAVFGPRSVRITYATVLIAIALAMFSLSWIVWTILMLVMLYVVGPHHPPTLDEDITLGAGRRALAVVALLIWLVCFTPAPISPYEPEPPRPEPTQTALQHR
jgi:membrane-associated protease RseP (regulator of RpoE activity)